jgi:Malectin domain/Abnormal spindle-like microcephaly-assoc'd, ASPM-SPD-2-Hydin
VAAVGRIRGTGIALALAVLAAAAACTTGPSGAAAADPTAVGFGPTPVGGHATATVRVTNVAASGALTIESTVVTGADRADFSDDFDDGGQKVLAPGQAFTITAAFDPSAAGDRSASLVIKHSGPDPLAVPLSGTATTPAPGALPLTAAPDEVDFGVATVGTQATIPVTLTNGGATTVTVSAATVAGTGAPAFQATLATPATVAAGGSLTVPVTFAPGAEGDAAARMVLTHSGTNTPLVVPLSGRGELGGGATVLYRINAGGPTLPASPVWEGDSGEAPSPYDNAAATGNQIAGWGDPVDLSDRSVPDGTPAALFASERFDRPVAPDLTYALPVPAGTPLELRLYLAEMNPPDFAAGSRVFDVWVDGHLVRDDVDVFSAVGARTALVLHIPVASDGVVDLRLAPVSGSASIKGLELLTTGGPPPPHLVAEPTTVDLGTVPIYLPRTALVEVTNAGATGPLTVTSLAVTGPDAVRFDARPVGGSLPVTLDPGQSLTVSVHVLGASPGPRRAELIVGHTGVGRLVVPLAATVDGTRAANGPPFAKGTLADAGVTNPTSLQFGPDGRLYVATQSGSIRALTIVRDGPAAYRITASETIDLVRTLPNHGDDGSLAPSVTGRLVTGLLVTGTASRPVIYAVSSDPRIGGGTSGEDLDVDTNSGVLSRLTRLPSGWQRTNLVRGLPRSEENHTGNGLALLPGTSTLLIAYGGNTNMGAPSHNFALVPEFALSGAVLAVDLAAIGSTTYDLPTLDDDARPGTIDAGDPFGGDNGANQARLVPGGPVQVYGSGFRNPYDVVVTSSGAVYSVDNGANAGWGGPPLPDDASGACTNAVQEDSHSDLDALLRITGPGYYGGHPNPTRASTANTFNAAHPQSPVTAGNPVECDYRSEVQRDAMTTFAYSTNGLAEYTASSFGGALKGDLLAASFDRAIYALHLSPDGEQVTSRTILATPVGTVPLDVTAQGDNDPFPGTIWVADYLGNAVTVLEPQEGVVCTGADDPALDEDGDGFSNADEIDNGTNPCSAAEAPPDADGDHVSDLNDPDDDNDGRGDASDPFALDPANGRSTNLPVVLTWDNDGPPLGGLLDLGFTGLMANGVTDYRDHFDAAGMTAGGAAGVVTVDAVGEGTAAGPGGTQDDAFQLGLNVGPSSAPFAVHTRLPAPFAGVSATGGQAYGIFVGDGSQDGYVSVTVAANGGADGYAVTREVNGTPATVTVPGPAWPGPASVDLFLRVDAAALTVQASASVDGGAPVALGPPQAVPASWLSDPARGLAAGIIGTSAGPAPPFPATWDFLEVVPAA